MEIKKIDWYLMFCFLFIFAALSFFSIYYYVYHVSACYADPLNFYAQKMMWEFNREFEVYGTVQLRGGNIMLLINFDGENRTASIEMLESQQEKNIFEDLHYGNISKENRHNINLSDVHLLSNNS